MSATKSRPPPTGPTWASIPPPPLLETSPSAPPSKPFTGARFGSSGTLTAARIITAAVKAVPVKQIGYAGLMVPGHGRQAPRPALGRSPPTTSTACSLTPPSAEPASTPSRCPATSPPASSARIISDVASLAFKWGKPLSARLQPVPGKKSGDPHRIRRRIPLQHHHPPPTLNPGSISNPEQSEERSR